MYEWYKHPSYVLPFTGAPIHRYCATTFFATSIRQIMSAVQYQLDTDPSTTMDLLHVECLRSCLHAASPHSTDLVLLVESFAEGTADLCADTGLRDNLVESNANLCC